VRHRVRNQTFKRPGSAREALIQHLSESLIVKGRIETTVHKAKETRRLTERLIRYALIGDLPAYRRALKLLGNSETTSYLFKEIAPLFKSRPGGYTRILRTRTRPGDGAELAIIELVERKVTPEKPKKVKAQKAPKVEEAPQEKQKAEKTSPSSEAQKETPLSSKTSEAKKEKKKEEKRGGFLANLRKFIKPKDRS